MGRLPTVAFYGVERFAHHHDIAKRLGGVTYWYKEYLDAKHLGEQISIGWSTKWTNLQGEGLHLILENAPAKDGVYAFWNRYGPAECFNTHPVPDDSKAVPTILQDVKTRQNFRGVILGQVESDTVLRRSNYREELLVADAIGRQLGRAMSFRPHPYHMTMRAPCPTDRTTNLAKCLAQYDLAVGYSSGALVDAVMHGVRMVVETGPYRFLPGGYSIYRSNSEQYQQTVQRHLGRYIWRRDQIGGDLWWTWVTDTWRVLTSR